METFGFRADGGARNKPLHDCSNERAAEADECCEDFGRHVIGGEVSQMANGCDHRKIGRRPSFPVNCMVSEDFLLQLQGADQNLLANLPKELNSIE